MDVSTASSSSTSAYQGMRRTHHHRQAQSSQDASSSSSTDPTKPQGTDDSSDGQDATSALDQILKNGGGVADIKAQLQKNFQAFQSSDKFKSLPPEVQQKIQSRESDDNLNKMAQGMVDRYNQTGTTKPQESSQGDRAQWMAKLEDQGRAQQAGVYQKFGVGGFAPSTAATTTPADASALPTDADSIAGA